MRKRPTERRCSLCNLSCRRQAVKPGQERGLQRRRNRQRSDWSLHPIPVVGLREHTTLDDGLRQFLDKQRDAVGAIYDLVGDLLGQDLAAGHVRNHLGTLPKWQAVESEECDVRTAGPRGREFRPEGHDHQDPQGGDSIDEQVEALSRRGIAPVKVLEHHQQRVTRRQSFDLRQTNLVGLLLALLWVEGERWITVTCRYRQPIRKQRDALAKVCSSLGEQRLKLSEPLLVTIVAPESGRPLELRD